MNAQNQLQTLKNLINEIIANRNTEFINYMRKIDVEFNRALESVKPLETRVNRYGSKAFPMYEREYTRIHSALVTAKNNIETGERMAAWDKKAVSGFTAFIQSQR